MRNLSSSEIHEVSGGMFVYVTQPWKDEQANVNGIIGALIGGAFGLGIAYEASAGLGIAMLAPNIIGGLLVGAALSYGLFYGKSRLENAWLENDTVYDFF